VRKFFLVAFVGAIAQMIDGALGMGYGVSSSTLLLALGSSAAVASATVHLGESGAGLASGISHWRQGNVSWRVVAWTGIPGAIGAFVGAVLLSGFDGEGMKPFTGAILLLLGIYLLARFVAGFRLKSLPEDKLKAGFLAPLGLFGGFIDAVGGGGWGPVTTPTLLTFGRMEPRRAIGSANTAELLVSLAASIGFLTSLGHQKIEGWSVLGLLLGGVVVAPIAAWITKRLPTQVMGAAVGGMLVVTNVRTLLKTFGVSEAIRTPVILALIAISIALVVSIHRREKRLAAAAPEPEGTPVLSAHVAPASSP
jgi:uncharacterized membrane protein YfcA